MGVGAGEGEGSKTPINFHCEYLVSVTHVTDKQT